jgi:hypothetical protein
MAKIRRLGDSGSLGQLASRIAVAKTGGPLVLTTVSAFASGLRVSHWSVDASNVSLNGTQIYPQLSSRHDATMTASIPVAAYRSASSPSYAIIAVTSDVMATTCVDGAGDEKIISWRIAQAALLPG